MCSFVWGLIRLWKSGTFLCFLGFVDPARVSLEQSHSCGLFLGLFHHRLFWTRRFSCDTSWPTDVGFTCCTVGVLLPRGITQLIAQMDVYHMDPWTMSKWHCKQCFCWFVQARCEQVKKLEHLVNFGGLSFVLQPWLRSTLMMDCCSWLYCLVCYELIWITTSICSCIIRIAKFMK